MTDEDSVKINQHYAAIETYYKNMEASYVAIWAIEDSPPNMEFATIDAAKRVLEVRSEERGTRIHGEHGGDVFKYVLSVNTVPYKATVVLQWNRYDKQFYYLDGLTECTVTRINDVTTSSIDDGV